MLNTLEANGLTITSLVRCKIFRLKTLHTHAVSSEIREVIPDCSTGYIFPLRSVKDKITRTLSPHGESTEAPLPRHGSMGKIHLSNKVTKRTTVVKDMPDPQTEPEDHGSGARRRRVNTTRPIGFDTADWRKLRKA